MDIEWIFVHDNLETLLQEANRFRPPMKFRAEVSNEKHVFPDTKSRFVGNVIDVNTDTRLTDTHQIPLTLKLLPQNTAAAMVRKVGPVVVVAVVLFYVHGKHLKSCRDGQLT